MNNNFFNKKWLLCTLLIVTLLNESQANTVVQKQMERKEENTCRIREDCEEFNLCIDGHCKHKGFFPLTEKELIGAFLIFIGSAISNAGGIGGGGLLVPILILYLNFYTKEAIPISKLMIFTGSLTAFIMGFKNKNPYRNATAIDYNIAIILIPLVLFGTMIGVTLNKIFPPWMILICLTIILIVNTYKTFRKGFEYYEKENSASNLKPKPKAYELEQKKDFDNDNKDTNMNEYCTLSTVDEGDEQTILKKDKNFEIKCINSPNDSYGLEIEEEDQFDSITRRALLKIEKEKDKSHLPFNKIIFCLISYSVLLIVTLLKGTGHTKSLIGITTCSPMYWAIYLSYLPISLVITYIVGKLVYEEYNYRLEIGYPYHPSDIKWTKEIIIKYPIYALSAGILSGLLGIGGGLILGPLLLDIGVHPLITTATSNFMVVFISSSTTLQYIMLGMMNFNYGFYCTLLSTFGSFVGTYIIQKYMEKSKRNSVLVFILAAVLAISTIFIPFHTITQITKQISNGQNIWVFHTPC